jgi:hypothetical protein
MLWEPLLCSPDLFMGFIKNAVRDLFFEKFTVVTLYVIFSLKSARWRCVCDLFCEKFTVVCSLSSNESEGVVMVPQ